MIFDKDLLFTKNYVFCLKNENFQVNFAHVLYVAMPKNLCVDFFYFTFVLFS